MMYDITMTSQNGHGVHYSITLMGLDRENHHLGYPNDSPIQVNQTW